MAFAAVRGSVAWWALSGKTVSNRTVLLEAQGQLHRWPQPVLHATTVVVQGCDKNFVYQLTPSVLPAVQTLYLLCHPTAQDWLQAWAATPQATLLLSSRYGHFKEQWTPAATNVLVVDDAELRRTVMHMLGAEEHVRAQ